MPKIKQKVKSFQTRNRLTDPIKKKSLTRSTSVMLGAAIIAVMVLVGGSVVPADAAQTIAKFLKVNGFIVSNNAGEQVEINKDKNNPGIELRSIDKKGLTPYIDFSNDAKANFDGRLMLVNDNLLRVAGADLQVPTKVLAAKYCDQKGKNCKTISELGGSGVSKYNVSCKFTSFSGTASCNLICAPNYGVDNVKSAGVWSHQAGNIVKVSHPISVSASATCVKAG